MKKQVILAVFVTATLFSCSTSSQVVNSWRDPNTTIANPVLHKIVVAALINDPGVRRQVEDYMASLYPGLATQAYTVFGDKPLNGNEDNYNQALKDQDFDGIVLMRQTNENISQHYVPGQLPSYYRTWGGYWHNGWSNTVYNPGTPGHVSTNRTWLVQVNVYSIMENKLIYSANTQTTNPGGRVPLFEDVCNAVRKQMKSDGFLSIKGK